MNLNIETKYNIGQKVWYVIQYPNLTGQPSYLCNGIIDSIKTITFKDGTIDIKYSMEGKSNNVPENKLYPSEEAVPKITNY